MIYLSAIILPFLINFGLIPLLIHIAHRNDWYDHVNSRKIHSGDIPRIGGVGIFISIIISGIIIAASFAPSTEGLQQSIVLYLPLFVSVLLIHIIGLLDDFANLRARYKLAAQIVIGIVIVISGRHFSFIGIPFSNLVVDLRFFGPLLTLIWVVGVTNAVNLIDGLDGLSGGVSAIGFFFLGLGGLALENEIGAIVGFLVFGASLAFLFFNYPPARIFMGDSGSLFLGVMAAILPFYSLPSAETRGFVLLFAATLFIIPILDTLAAIFRRNRKQRPFYTPDQEHLHHKLLACGASNKTILTILYGITFLSAVTVYWWILTRTTIAMVALLSVWVGTLYLFFHMHSRSNGHSCNSVPAVKE